MITSRIVTASAALAASALVAVGLAACAPPQKGAAGGDTDTGVKVAEAKSAADFSPAFFRPFPVATSLNKEGFATASSALSVSTWVVSSGQVLRRDRFNHT